MRRGKTGKYLVFVSHAAMDTWVANQIARNIERRGASVFLDILAVEAGDDFEDKIRKNLNAANELLVLITPWSLERPYVWAELGAAWNQGIPIIAVLHGVTPAELQSRPQIPLFLKQRSLIELNNVEKYFEQLAGRCARAGTRRK